MTQNKYVIFDMDGVLFDTEALTIRIWEQIAEEYSIPHVTEVCHLCVGINAVETERIFEEHYGDRLPIHDIRKEVAHRFRHILQTEGPPPKPYADQILPFLKGKGYLLAVASSTVSHIVHQNLTTVGFIQYFDQIIDGDMVQRSKPYPDIFLKACEALRCTPADAYVIEDSFHGIRAAHAAGTTPLMVPDLFQPNEEIRKLCHAVFSDLGEVQTFFKNM
ncbi:Phosphorylated carbohydrates phosphatase TM_1254 [uncultured Clostridium sp.]|uniref:HAD family phosphatase n=1 Tax=Flintibacter hominis TaxID=2763048 RepID=A0A8J6J801_9FIRM|nr:MULTISPECIES: HAD family phosphatase [Eubacteriales]MBC5722426.1 HAD family phosphatase [Flintibacter hominis]MCU6703814.1 HAD family phosphatase [Muriventricola aceti]SCH05181.1 Phosphorylated carbohydrates phosphatase TM_1254 [uncultured Clostridium sp.]SCJ60720.1 Phosphorylated carbohydrates phosphatase TM_1254 [uncultured Flavonifractor sp.]